MHNPRNWTDEDDPDIPAPTLLDIIRNEGDWERRVSWQIEYVPSVYWLWLPHTFYSYKGRPWGYRDGVGLRWFGFIVRLYGRFHSW